MNQPTLTIFANFRINNEERLKRMKDSFNSFKNINATRWVINIRGLYKEEAVQFLITHLNELLVTFQLDSEKGWFHDTREMLPQIKTDYVFFWIEDHINITDIKNYSEILIEMERYGINHLLYTWWHNSSKEKFVSTKEYETTNLNYYDLTLSNVKKIEDYLDNYFYIISAAGIFDIKLFKEIIKSNHPKDKRWPIQTPFDFEKRSTDLEFLPIKVALPKYELFASIDDNHGNFRYSLIDRGLYTSVYSREELTKLEKLEDKYFELFDLKHLFKEIQKINSFNIYGYGELGELLYLKYKNTNKISQIIDKNKNNQKLDNTYIIQDFDEISTFKNNIFIITILNEEQLSNVKKHILNKKINSKLILLSIFKRA